MQCRTSLWILLVGSNSLKHCQKHVAGVVLVTDDEIRSAVTSLYNRGFVVEASGAAGYAALLHNRVPSIADKNVVCVITGGNVTPEEMVDLQK
jgi:threonine dehydratase